ncbi:D-alanyl-lipoteichoic acid acyltransferase DltB (MBOAT superfamily) [Rhizobium tibeticum]|nr:D-alanyl-lipoteichoic acid acyltransferase DltB (MBOAT superfamily) [Rhizobium tibeticum]
MLFNSREFLFAFLPATLLLTYLGLRLGGRAAGILTLTGASFFFYGWWDYRALSVIIMSIAFNFSLANAIAQRSDARQRRGLLWTGVIGNLGLLGYFKYANFAVENLQALLGLSVGAMHIVLPLAISFYTFQQIAFLVDTYDGKVSRTPFRDYLISVVFFPHLIAGPLLHYRDIIAQFERKFSVGWATISVGLPIFIVGLAKKVAIADPIAQFVSPLYAKAVSGPLDFASAWAAALGYTAQLYFDFSGYSDMAIGIAVMFGIALPINFLSPYKATSIIEFWRRWHITLSNFLRDYIYFRLGGGRVGEVRRYLNLMIVMALGGLWHGAAWTFVFWGFLHGSYLVVNHLWRSHVSSRLGWVNDVLAPAYLALTFIVVVIGWVFFRAEDFTAASHVLVGMFSLRNIGLPVELQQVFGVPAWSGIAWGVGLSFSDFSAFWVFVLLAYLIISFAPNTAEIFGLDGANVPVVKSSGHRSSSFAVGATTALIWIACFGIFSAAPSEFLYFKF